MKKRILILGVVLALLLAMVLPTAALADTTVTGSVAATPTVTSVYITGGTVDHSGTGTPAITITGTNFVVPVSGDPVTTVTIASGTGIAVGVGAVTVASTTSITTTFTIAADSGAAARIVHVTVAGKTNAESITFTVDAWITVNAPTGGTLGYMTAGATKLVTLTQGTVTSNSPTWSVSAVDAKVTNPVSAGYMTRDGTLATALAAKFQISKTASAYTDADTALNYTTQPATLPLSISQVVAADAVAGSYQITITFTSSY